MTPEQRRVLLIAIIVLIFGSGALLIVANFPNTIPFRSSTVPPLDTQSRTGIIIPLFSQNYSQSQVEEIIQAKEAHPTLPFIVVANFGNGPGSSFDASKEKGIKSMQNAGIVVLGYVPTGWGRDNLSTIEHGMATFHQWYQVDGIYLDQMVNWEFGSAGQYLPPFYTSLTSYGKSLGMSEIVGNSGADVPYFFVGTVDRIGIFENAFTPPVSYLEGWHQTYNKSNFWFVSYNVSSINPFYLASASDSVSYLFLTTGERPYPYNSLPSYFNQLVSDLDSLVPVTFRSETLNGSAIPAGFEINVTQPDGISNTALTPSTFNMVSGSQVVVSARDHAGFVFDHWSDGNLNRTRSITVTQAMTLVAYSKTGTRTTSVVAVKTTATDGTPVTGVWTVASSPNGTVAAAGYTPFTFEAERHVRYSISVANYQNLTFVGWKNGSNPSQRSINVTPTQNLVLNAYFRRENSTASNSPLTATMTTSYALLPTISSGLIIACLVGLFLPFQRKVGKILHFRTKSSLHI